MDAPGDVTAVEGTPDGGTANAPTPDARTPDVAGLRKLAATLGVLADDLEAAGTSLGEVPKPTVGGYGWRGTAEAVGDVLASWSAEVEVIRQACDELGRAATLSADELQATADRASGRFSARTPQ